MIRAAARTSIVPDHVARASRDDGDGRDTHDRTDHGAQAALDGV
jgi:hypothetical protein